MVGCETVRILLEMWYVIVRLFETGCEVCVV